MKWRFGDEMTPLLRVKISRDPFRDTIIVGVGGLPDNHPLALALDVFVDHGAEEVRMSGLASRYFGFARLVAIATHLVVERATESYLVLWYHDHQNTLNQPNRSLL